MQKIRLMAFNDARKHSESQLWCAFVVDTLEAKGFDPTFEDVLACAKRDPSYMNNPAKQKTFDLHVDVLLL